MPRPLKEDRAPTGWKSLCPFCPYDAGECGGNPNTHNLRKHIHNKHKEQVLTYVTPSGFKLVALSPTITIKHNPTTGKYGQGFCFKCCSHIYCGMPTAATKLSVIGAHTCAPKQVREYTKKGDAPVATRPKRIMTDSGSLAELLTKYGIDVITDDDERPDIEKTLQCIKAKQDEPTFIQKLRRHKKFAAVICPMLSKAREEHDHMYSDWDPEAEDPDDRPPPYDEDTILWQLMPGLLSAETKETHKDKIIAGLRIEKDQMEDRVEQCKIAQEYMKAEYEERLQHLSILYSDCRAECEKLKSGTNKVDSPDTIAHQ